MTNFKFKSLLGVPIFYEAFQRLMGAKKGRLFFVNNYVKPKINDRILDFGCGPADIYNILKNFNVEYYGVDISYEYLKSAKEKYGHMAKFGTISSIHDFTIEGKFDVVIMSGVMHHLDNCALEDLLDLIRGILKIGGRLVTVDPCLEAGKLSNILVRQDRGQFVRDKNQYLGFLKKFLVENSQVLATTFPPYRRIYISARVLCQE